MRDRAGKADPIQGPAQPGRAGLCRGNCRGSLRRFRVGLLRSLLRDSVRLPTDGRQRPGGEGTSELILDQESPGSKPGGATDCYCTTYGLSGGRSCIRCRGNCRGNQMNLLSSVRSRLPSLELECVTFARSDEGIELLGIDGEIRFDFVLLISVRDVTGRMA